MQIRPASNKQLRLWRKLQQTKYRKKEGLFLAEGERCVEQIVDNGFIEIDSIILEKGYAPGFECAENAYEVESSDFKSLSDTDSPQGILAVCKIPAETSLEQLTDVSGVIVALDAVQDPGNVGTIIRTAAWFGAAGIFYGHGTADPFHPKVVRSSAGATGALPYLKGDLNDHLSQFESNGWHSYLMDGGEQSVEIETVKPGEYSILVIGNEGNGISEELFKLGRTSVQIPGDAAVVESLNAAIAMGIGIYRFTLQKK